MICILTNLLLITCDVSLSHHSWVALLLTSWFKGDIQTGSSNTPSLWWQDWYIFLFWLSFSENMCTLIFYIYHIPVFVIDTFFSLLILAASSLAALAKVCGQNVLHILTDLFMLRFFDKTCVLNLFPKQLALPRPNRVRGRSKKLAANEQC